MTKLAPYGMTMSTAFSIAQEEGEKLAVKAGELVSATFEDGASPSALARKAHLLLLMQAAGDGWQDRWHSITKRDLGMGHQTIARVRSVMKELSRTLLRIHVKGAPHDQTGAIISDFRISTRDTPQAVIEYRFSETVREVMRLSGKYTVLNLHLSAGLESRYAVTLYEIGSQYVGRHYRTWRGSVAEFRAQLGVPATYRDWTDIRRRCVDPALRELAEIAPFNIQVVEVRKGRVVREVGMTFTNKEPDDLQRSLALLAEWKEEQVRGGPPLTIRAISDTPDQAAARADIRKSLTSID